MKKMLHKNAIKYVKQEYTLIFIYYVIRFGIIRFEYLSFGIWYFTSFGPPLLTYVTIILEQILSMITLRISMRYYLSALLCIT